MYLINCMILTTLNDLFKFWLKLNNLIFNLFFKESFYSLSPLKMNSAFFSTKKQEIKSIKKGNIIINTYHNRNILSSKGTSLKIRSNLSNIPSLKDSVLMSLRASQCLNSSSFILHMSTREDYNFTLTSFFYFSSILIFSLYSVIF